MCFMVVVCLMECSLEGAIGYVRDSCLLRPYLHAAIRIRGDVENLIAEMYAGDGQRRPLLGQAGVHGVGVAGRREAEEAVEHDLWHEHAFHELLIHSKILRDCSGVARP